MRSENYVIVVTRSTDNKKYIAKLSPFRTLFKSKPVSITDNSIVFQRDWILFNSKPEADEFAKLINDFRGAKQMKCQSAQFPR